MIVWQEPITDRSQSDVDELKKLLAIPYRQRTNAQKRRLLKDHKGAINRSDLERIESNLQLLSDVLEIKLSTYYNNVPDIPTASYFNKLKSNITTLRKSYSVHSTTPKVPSLPFNTYKKWNDIEKIMTDIYDELQSNFYQFAGEGLHANDEINLLL